MALEPEAGKIREPVLAAARSILLACTPKAKPPMIRYSTPFRLKARMRSFISLVNISANFLDTVCRFGHLTNRCQPFSYGKALPVAIIFGILVFKITDLANQPVWISLGDSCPRTAGDVCPQFSGAVGCAAFWAGAQNFCAGRGLLTRAHPARAFGEEDLVWNGAQIEALGPAWLAVFEIMGSPA